MARRQHGSGIIRECSLMRQHREILSAKSGTHMKKSSTITEREVSAQLAEELNKMIAAGGTPFEKATVEHRAGNQYPDITIWRDYSNRQAFAFWELKAPNRHEDISKLPSKAKSLEVEHAVVWNFQHGTLYKIKDNKIDILRSYPVPILNSLNDWTMKSKRIAAIEQARIILGDLTRLANDGSLMSYEPDKFYFIGVLEKAVSRLVPILQEYIFEKKKDKDARNRLDRWIVEQGYQTSLPELDKLLAQHWAYSLAVRILFYFTIRRRYKSLPDLDPNDSRPISDLLKDAFSKAQAVDWQAVFEPSPLDGLGLPQSVDSTLRELLKDFRRYDFSLLKEDVIGQIMEGLIPEEERHALGQYFTREDLVDFIIGFVARCDRAYYLDPTCGTGTFLNRLYSRLRWLSGYRAGHGELLERLWGVDVAHFPAELATINLFRQSVNDQTNFPRIVVRDFFDVSPSKVVSFPPLKATTPNYSRINIPIPYFDGIVGNFPYIRQELIEREISGYKRKIVSAIAHEWFWKDQDLFKVKHIRKPELQRMSQQPKDSQRKWLEEQVGKENVDLHLSGKADIYAYLFYHAAAFLKEGGRIGIVTSNAWLDVEYGLELKRFFLRHFKIIAIVASWCEPWFEEASVNTAFVILERCENPEERDRNVVRFVKMKKPLAELLPQDLLLQEADRWKVIDAMVREIETANLEVAFQDPIPDQTQPIHGVRTIEKDKFRIRLLPQREMENDLGSKKGNAKWGIYIRAPQVYFDILSSLGDKLVPLGRAAEVRWGLKTGINEFFCLKPTNQKEMLSCEEGSHASGGSELGASPGSTTSAHGQKSEEGQASSQQNKKENPTVIEVENGRKVIRKIEQDCLISLLKSLKEVDKILIDSNSLCHYIFLPTMIARLTKQEATSKKQNREKKLVELRKKLETELETRYPLAYDYVKWGEQQRNHKGQPWTELPSVRQRHAWWLLELPPEGNLLISQFVDKRFFFPIKGSFAVANTFFVVSAKSPEDADTLAAFLNSSLYALETEIKGRVNLGEGLLTVYGPDIDAMLIPDPKSISPENKRKIESAFNEIKNRTILPVEKEIKERSRNRLDKAVLEALGLDPDKYLPRIYQGLIEMVNERLSLPKSRVARKKQVKRLSVEQVREQVRLEEIPSGLKHITAFLPVGNHEMIDIPLTNRPVRWKNSDLLAEYTLLDESGKSVGNLENAHEVQARYATCAARSGEFMVRIPANPMIAEKALAKYTQYLREVARRLRQRALEATRDQAQAYRIAKELLKAAGVPEWTLNEIID